MSHLEVTPVNSRKDLDEFVRMPFSLYPRDSLWTPPLNRDLKRLLDKDAHPFWKFSEQALFLARRHGKTVGRIAGIIDGNANRYHSENACGWGFFECAHDPEASTALFAAVEEWGRSKGMDFLRGPLNPSTNYSVGMLYEGFDNAPALMMTYNPEYYLELVAQYGFRKEKDILSLLMTRSSTSRDRIQRLGERILRNPNIRIRSAKKKNFQAEMAIVREIYNDAWADNWGFVPMTDDEMEETARELLPIMDEELIFFTYYNDEPVSVCLTVPDANPILRMLHGKLGPWGAVKALAYRRKIDKARILALGVKKGFRKLGVPLAAFQYLRGILVQKNYRFLEVGWNLEDNVDIIGFEKEAGCEIHNKYRIFRKDFEIG